MITNKPTSLITFIFFYLTPTTYTKHTKTHLKPTPTQHTPNKFTKNYVMNKFKVQMRVRPGF